MGGVNLPLELRSTADAKKKTFNATTKMMNATTRTMTPTKLSKEEEGVGVN